MPASSVSLFWGDLQGDDVAVGAEEVLQACVAGGDEDSLGHLGERAGAGEFLAGLGVAPDDLLGGVVLQSLEGLDGDVGSDQHSLGLRADEGGEAEGGLIFGP